MQAVIKTSLVLILAMAVGTAAHAQTKKPRLGVRVETGGVMVDEVTADAPAGKAGMRRGDVIVQCAGKDVGSVEDIVAWLDGIEAGAASTIAVRRAEGLVTLNVAFPDPLPDGAKLGVAPGEGLLVIGVDDGSVAQAAGVKAGDVLVGFGSGDIAGFDDLQTRIGRVGAGDERTIRFLRDGKEMKVTAQFGDGPPQWRGGVGQGRDQGHRMPPGMPPIPGMGGLATFMKLPEVNGRLQGAIDLLRTLEPNDTLKKAIAELEAVHVELGQASSAIEGVRGMAEQFMGGFEGLKDMDLPEGMPDIEEIQRRVHELMGKGLDPAKIREKVEQEMRRKHGGKAEGKAEGEAKPEKHEHERR